VLGDVVGLKVEVILAILFADDGESEDQSQGLVHLQNAGRV
jgi:hypothetical protein